MKPSEIGQRIGHEAVGVVEAIGEDVRKIKVGDFVIMPFACSDMANLMAHSEPSSLRCLEVFRLSFEELPT